MSIGLAFLFAAVGYVLSSSIWFSLCFGLIAYGGASLMGYMTARRVAVLLVGSFLLTSLVMYKFDQTVNLGTWLKVGGGSLFNVGGINIGGPSITGAATAMTPNAAAATVTTTTLYQGSSTTTTLGSKGNCNVDCSIFNGDFEYKCNANTTQCDKVKCSVDGECLHGFVCKYGECSLK